MNVLSIFEQRISAIFEEGAPGQRKPFSFRRLAKRAVRDMEDETFVIDGIDTAPALYTVLVSTKDDELMRPMYASICDEISQLVEAQAKKRGYTFVGRPLVRFMVDPGLRGGRFSVFAENIDPRTLARLRDEENTYLGITTPHDIPADQGVVPDYVPIEEQEPAPIASQVDFVEKPEAADDSLEEPIEPSPEISTTSADETPTGEDVPNEDENALEEPPLEDVAAHGLAVAPIEEPKPKVPVVEPVSQVDRVTAPEDESDTASATDPEAIPASEDHDVPTRPAPATAAPEVEEVPTTRARHMASSTLPVPEPPLVRFYRAQQDTCTLTDKATGRSYRIIVRRTPIGRERVGGGIVLRDPNVSRRHAEIVFENGAWMIRDLGSTNGTLVDDMVVQEAMLTDGDVITIGLTNLEFRAG